MKLRQFYKGKLVRDKIPQIMKDQGIITHNHSMKNDEYLKALKDKLLEETLEIQKSSSQDELIEEVADLFEVMHALMDASGLSLEQISEARSKKNLKKGAFAERTFLKMVEMEETNPHIHQYQKNNIDQDCIFCRRGREGSVIAQYKHCYVIKDQYPVSPGHLLIIPFEHTLNWFTASDEVKFEMVHALSEMKALLDLEHHPNGYNIGMNCGSDAGQSVMHLHVHLIPRYKGDMDNPRGGVRGVIPSKQDY